MPEIADKHQPERPPLLLAQEPDRTYTHGQRRIAKGQKGLPV